MYIDLTFTILIVVVFTRTLGITQLRNVHDENPKLIAFSWTLFTIYGISVSVDVFVALFVYIIIFQVKVIY